MPRKKPRRVSRKVSQRKSVLDRRVENFSEEVETLGNRMEKRGEEWDTWFHRTLGIVAPLISSIFGLLVLALVVWVIGFLNIYIGVSILSSISTFLMTNMALFFLVFLFFSYTSYFSRAHPKIYMPLSPFVTGVGAVIGFWIIMNAISIVNIYVGSSVLSGIALYINNNFPWIFGFFVVLGFLALSINMVARKPIETTRGRVVMRRTAKKTRLRRIKRLYRSGEDKVLGGVCGGIAEYLGVDPAIIRLLWIIGTFAWGSGILFYIIAWIIIPRNPYHKWD